jgi:enoyl-CoA hydratase/carnithine racemase
MREERLVADLEFDVQDGVGTILLNRPERKNAFTLEMIDEWAAVLRKARTDPEVRTIILTGAGDGFCSGVDLGAFSAGGSEPMEVKRNLTERIHRVALALQDLDKPVIAAVKGVAVGAGMDMALMCDIRLAARSARFLEGYIRVGLIPGDGGCYFLPRLVGTARALELLLTGDFVDAAEAERIGIVNHVYDDDRLQTESMALARRLADGPPIATAMIKRATYQSANCDLRTALDLISSHMAVVQSTHDSREAYQAFVEKRPGVFEGR